MESPATEVTFVPLDGPAAFAQPKPWLRWAAIILAAAGWYVSYRAFLVSAQVAGQDALLARFCGGPDASGRDNCSAVLTSPQAYAPLGHDAGALRIPMATFGMSYFAALLLWYLFIGPPTHSRRVWHLVPLLVLIGGVWYSVSAIQVMAHVLHRWCPICMAAHGLNGGLVLLTLIAWPWRRPRRVTRPHPAARLAPAVLVAGSLSLLVHVLVVYVLVAGSIMRESTAEYSRIVSDPQFVRWDFQRQSPVDIPLYPDEPLGGSPDAPHTVVVFGDFQCNVCKQSHEMLMEVARKYPGQLRVAFRYYPQDPACNPNPRFRTGGHLSACRAVQAAEAARTVGGLDAYLKMRRLLWERQNLLPQEPLAQQSTTQRQLFENWAAELGLDRAAFEQAMEAADSGSRIRSDIELADKLGISAVPVVYMDGKRVLGWSKAETWDALLGEAETPASQAETMPAGS
jgi:protein-disulfide isomerase/uncharacterized membrane protein